MIPNRPTFKITIAIYAAVLALLLFLSLFVFIGYHQRKAALSDAKALALEVARRTSVETEHYFSRAYSLVVDYSQKAEVFRREKVSREAFAEMIKRTLEIDPHMLCLWTTWEPNAYDGRDVFYANKGFHDSTGLFEASFFKVNGNIIQEKVSSDEYDEPYYSDPKRFKRVIFVEPYLYEYRGYSSKFYETSIVAPIIIKEKFYGIVGVDIELTALQHRFDTTSITKSSKLALISNRGELVTHTDSAFVRKNINDFLGADDSMGRQAMRVGREYAYETYSQFSQKVVYRILRPIRVGVIGTNWTMMVEVPLEDVNQRARVLSMISLAILIIGLALMIYLMLNIIERKRYEKMLLGAIAKAEENEKLKSAFLFNISHEIRTPLNGIVGFSALMSEENTTLSERRKFTQIIQSSCYQLTSIVDSVLDISSIETHQCFVRITEVKLHELLDSLKALYLSAAYEKGVELKFSSIPEVTVKTDHYKLRQILAALVSNAVKFTESGYVSVEMEYNQKAELLVFKVTDTGIGIKPENLSMIFERFVQEEHSLNRLYGGAGLGLSIAKAFVEMLGGQIWVSSIPNQGSCFNFSIPVGSKSAEEFKEVDKNLVKGKMQETLKATTILIAEDDAVNYELIFELLKPLGVNTLYAANGKEAVELCQTHPEISLVLMDVKMPVMDGFEATRKIKLRNRHLPVVAVTAFANSIDGSNRVLFDSVMAKPYVRKELIDTIYHYTRKLS